MIMGLFSLKNSEILVQMFVECWLKQRLHIPICEGCCAHIYAAILLYFYRNDYTASRVTTGSYQRSNVKTSLVRSMPPAHNSHDVEGLVGYSELSIANTNFVIAGTICPIT